MTNTGGVSNADLSNGVIFSIGADGSSYHILHEFGDGSTANDGANPGGSLVPLGSTLYGMTSSGGSIDDGTVFSITTSIGPPGEPTEVTATAGNTKATVFFTPPSDGGSTITSYTVTSSPGKITASGTASPITVTGLTDGVAYTFTVTATNAVGTGPASSPSNSVTPCALPGAPRNVSAKAGNAQATVSFKSPASNGGGLITSYTAKSSPGAITASGAGSPITVLGLTDGTSYTFTVTATNAAGVGPASTPSKPVTPTTVPGAPTNVIASAGNARATVSFTPPASNGGSTITSYTVTSNPGGKKATGAKSPITVTGLSNGTSYTFTVTAKNKFGTGPASSPSNSVTPEK